MRQLSLFWKLYLSYVLVIVLALLMVVVGSYAVGVFRESFLAQPVATLTPQAHSASSPLSLAAACSSACCGAGPLYIAAH
jgi:hypothetical protein